MNTIKKYEKKIKDLNRWLFRCRKGSKNRLKVIAKLQAVYRKLKNARKYYIHFITSILTKENDCLVTENLKVKDMIEKGNHTMSKYLSDSSLSEIIRQLEYKCKWQNKMLIKVPQYYASSQICNQCNCHNDRDINASLNILEKGIELYYKEQYVN